MQKSDCDAAHSTPSGTPAGVREATTKPAASCPRPEQLPRICHPDSRPVRPILLSGLSLLTDPDFALQLRRNSSMFMLLSRLVHAVVPPSPALTGLRSPEQSTAPVRDERGRPS